MQMQRQTDYQSFFAAKNGADLSVKMLAEQVDNNYLQLDPNATRYPVTSKPNTMVSSPSLLQWAEKQNLQALQDGASQQIAVNHQSTPGNYQAIPGNYQAALANYQRLNTQQQTPINYQRPKTTHFTQQYNSYQVYPYQTNALPPPPNNNVAIAPNLQYQAFNQALNAPPRPLNQAFGNTSIPLDYLYSPAKNKGDYDRKCQHQRVINILMRLFPEVSAEFVLIVFQQASFDELLAAERLLAMKEAMLFRDDGD